MDTVNPAKADVSGMINEIKDYMPAVYAAIKARAEVVGNGAFELVRRGLRGEPGCFWALEGGRVVGTPFSFIRRRAVSLSPILAIISAEGPINTIPCF